MIVARVVSGVTGHFALRFPEWLLTFILLNFGLTLLRAGSTFDLSPSFRIMREMASEEAWGIALVAIALARLAALVLNGTFRPFRRWSPFMRCLGAGLSVFAWFTIALGILAGSTISTGVGTYAGLMIGDIVITIIVAREAGAAERDHKHGRS